MRKIPALFLPFILFLSSCNKHNDPVPQKYFEVAIDPNYITTQANWIMLHDQNGVFLDAKQFSAGDNLTFETTSQIVNNKIAVTRLSVASDLSSFSFQTFLCEDTQAKWTIKNLSNNFDRGSKTGSLNVTISDPQIGSSWDSYLSSKFNDGDSPTSSIPNTSMTFPAVDVTTTVKDYFISVYDKNDIPHYKFIENVTSGQFTYSLSDFSSFDNVLTVSLPSNLPAFWFIAAYENDTDLKNLQGFYMQSLSGLIESKTRKTLNIGLLNRFKKYSINIFTNDLNHLQYESWGNAPTSIAMPTSTSINTTVTDKSFNTYSVSSVDYTWRSTVWSYFGKINGLDTSITWEVIASSEYFKNPSEIPKVILDKYPFLKQDFSYGSSTFYKIDKPWSYVLGRHSGTTDLSSDYTQISKFVSN